MKSPKKYTSIQEFLQDYENNPEWFHMMVPIQSIQDIGPIYKPVINLVFISKDLEDGEIYHQKKAKNPDGDSYDHKRYSLTKKGLFLIRSAADARFIESKQSIDREAKTITYTVTMQFHNTSGGWSTITKSKTVKTYIQLRDKTTQDDPEAAQKAETGAQDRCIRDAFNIKHNYPIEAFDKPFVAVYFDLDENKDQDVKLAKIEAALGPTQLFYGGMRNGMSRLPQGSRPTITDGNAPIEVDSEEKKVHCSWPECGVEISSNVAEISIKEFKYPFCYKHQTEARKKAKQDDKD